jgi:hypothetical protein
MEYKQQGVQAVDWRFCFLRWKPLTRVLGVLLSLWMVSPRINAATLANISNLTISEDAGVQTVPLTGIAGTNGAITITATSDLPDIIPNPTVTYRSPQATGTLKFTAVTNASGGPVTITVTATDSAGATNKTFTVTINAVNDVPIFALSTNNVKIAQNTGAQTFAAFVKNISPGPADESTQTVAFIVTPKNPTDFLVAPAIDGTNGDLTFNLKPAYFGTNTLDVSLRDTGGTANTGKDTTTNKTFTLSVARTPVSLDKFGVLAPILEGTNAQTVVITNISGYGALQLTAASTNTGFFTNLSVGRIGGLAEGSVSARGSNYSTAPVVSFTGGGGSNAAATATVLYSVANVRVFYSGIGYDDKTRVKFIGGGGSNATATVVTDVDHHITAVNITSGGSGYTTPPDIELGSSSGGFSAVLWAELSGYIADLKLTNPGAGYTSAPTVVITDTAGSNAVATVSVQTGNTIHYTPAPDTNGVGYVNVTLTDANGTKTNSALKVTVTPVNDAPSFLLSTNLIVVAESAGAQSFSGAIKSFSMGPPNEAGQKPTFVLKSVITNDASFSRAPAISASGVLTFTVKPGVTGFFPYRVTLKDNGAVANGGRDTSPSDTLYISVTNVIPASPITVDVPTTITFYEDKSTNVNLKVTSSERPNVHLTARVADTSLVSAVVNGTGANRTVLITGQLHRSGATTIDLICNDGIESFTKTINIIVTDVNYLPVMSGLPTSVTINEDSGAHNYSFSVSDVENDTPTMSVVVLNADLATASLSGAGQNQVLTITPKDSAVGTTKVEVYAAEGNPRTTNSVGLVILPVNHAPYFELPEANQTITVAEDSGKNKYTAFLANIRPAKDALNENAQKVSFTCVANSTNGLSFLAPPTITPLGVLSFQTASNSYGAAKVTVIAKDTGGTANGGVDTYQLAALTNITVTYPGFGYDDRHNISISGGGGSGAYGIAILSGGSVVGATMNSQGSGYTNATVTISKGYGAGNLVVGSGATATAIVSGGKVTGITITDGGSGYVDTSYGPPTITITGNGSGASATAKIGYPVTGFKVLAGGSGYSGSTGVSITRGAGDTTGTNATAYPIVSGGKITGVTLSNGGIGYTATPLLTFTNAGGGSGAVASVATGSTLTGIRVMNGGTGYTSAPVVNIVGGLSSAGSLATATAQIALPISFDLVVTQVFYPPVLGKIPNLTLLENFRYTNIIVPLQDKNMPWLDLRSRLYNPNLTITSDKPGLVYGSASVNWASSNSIYLSLYSVGRSNSLSKPTLIDSPLGSATVTVTVNDGLGATISNQFMVTVTPVNDAPTFNLMSYSVTANKFMAPQVVSNQIYSVMVGRTSDETEKQTYRVNTTVSAADAKLFVKLPQIDTNGTLTFTPGTNRGNVPVTVTVSDTGGTAKGGLDTSYPAIFNIYLPANPFPNVQGEYNGLFYNGSSEPASIVAGAGFISLKVDKIGALSGYILNSGASNRIVGQFDVAGNAYNLAISNTTPALILTSLSIDTDPEGNEWIRGNLTIGTNEASAALTLVRSIVGTTTTLAKAACGDFNLCFGGSSEDLPGFGIGMVNVTTNGVLTFNGSLADGTSVTQQVALSKYAEWPLYLPAYKNGANGMAIGWMTFSDQNPDQAFSQTLTRDGFNYGGLRLLKLAAEGGAYTTNGFNFVSYPNGSPYQAWDGLWSGASLWLGGGNLINEIFHSVQINYDTIIVNDPSDDQLSLTLDPATGKITGSFVDVYAGRTNNITAVVIKGTYRANGYFLGGNKSGYFYLRP